MAGGTENSGSETNQIAPERADVQLAREYSRRQVTTGHLHLCF
jgi:hypothetical protein